jgi:hypothetical protein
MRGSAEAAGMPYLTSRRVFFDRDTVRQYQVLEMELQFAPNFYLSETRPFCTSIFGIRFECIFSLAFLSSSSVAAFRGPIPTAEIDCVLRPHGRQAKSSHQKRPILMQFFQASARMLVGSATGLVLVRMLLQRVNGA